MGIRTRRAHDVAATLNQRRRRWFDVAATSCARRVDCMCHFSYLQLTTASLQGLKSRLAKWQIRPCLPRWGGQGLRGELFYLYLHWAFPNTCIFIRSKQGLRWATSYAVLSLYNIYLYLYIYIYISMFLLRDYILYRANLLYKPM